MVSEKIFRAYDIRGTYPDELNEEIAGRVALAFAEKIKPKTVVVGRDLREASEKMFDSVVKALIQRGINVKDAGQMTNPMLGFAVFHYGFDGGLILSASHNPVGYGGIKMFKKNAVTIPGNDEEIKKYVLGGISDYKGKKGKVEKIQIDEDYVRFVRTIIEQKKLQKKKILLDPLYGSVGLILDKVLEGLPIERVDLHTSPDPAFGGLPEPNPLNRQIQKEALGVAKKEKPDFGVIWDGDGDRVFFLDEKGKFIDAPYLSALLVEVVSQKHPKPKVVSDPRIIWPIEKAARKVGAQHILSKSGYRFIKEAMMKHKAVFGAEMTAHYFFAETNYMDNGIIPFLMVWQLLSTTSKKLSELIASYKENHFMLEELKFKIEEPLPVIETLKEKYKDGKQNEMDGLTVEYPDWRFNFRASQTEPVAKFNLEAKSKRLAETKKQELMEVIES